MSGIYGSVLPGGSIEQFGDYQEWLEDREVSNYKEFQEIWLFCFPDEEYWYSFTAIERKEERYRGIFLMDSTHKEHFRNMVGNRMMQ